MKKIVAVTGASGHIGVALLHEFKKQPNYIVRVVLHNSENDHIKGLYDEAVFADVRNLDELKLAFRGADSVFHLAGIITIGKEDQYLLKSVNIEGTKNVIEACKLEGVKRLIYTSSVHAIPVLNNNLEMKEPSIFDPKKVIAGYAKSKAIATHLVQQANGANLETVICFPSGVIGPYAYKRSNIGQLILDYKNKKIPIYFKGAYNFVDSRDVAHGLVMAEQLGRSGEGYLLSGDVISVKELFQILEEKTGVKKPKIKLPVFVLKMLAPFAELYYKVKKQKPVFTSYSIHTVNSNCNFTNQKAKEELLFTTRPLKESFEDEIDFMLSLEKN